MVSTKKHFKQQKLKLQVINIFFVYFLKFFILRLNFSLQGIWVNNVCRTDFFKNMLFINNVFKESHISVSVVDGCIVLQENDGNICFWVWSTRTAKWLPFKHQGQTFGEQELLSVKLSTNASTKNYHIFFGPGSERMKQWKMDIKPFTTGWQWWREKKSSFL